MPKKIKPARGEAPPVQRVYIHVNHGYDEKGCVLAVIEKGLLILFILAALGFIVVPLLNFIGSLFGSLFEYIGLLWNSLP